ncbi:MAG: tetratricopeptide repeat protein [Nitrospinae bacterium]|nr:tetratricopeptide repeat protein [Nitrospinota bacterium]
MPGQKSVLGKIAFQAALLLFLGVASGNAQTSPGGLSGSGGARVESIRIGGHPEYTRIFVNLSSPAPYRVRADFLNKKISLVLAGSTLGPKAQSRVFKDKNLEKIEVRQDGGAVAIDLFLKNQNSRFIHLVKADPPQIVLDLKGVDQPFVKTKIGKLAPPGKPAAKGEEEKTRVSGMTQEQAQEILKKETEEKLVNGWEDYQAALKSFQNKEYAEAAQLFKKFRKTYPKSKYLEDTAYLLAEAQFHVAQADRHPIYEKAFKAYQFAVREYPNSKFQDHALLKLAYLYEELGYFLESRTLYEQGIRAIPNSLYNPSRQLGLASLLMKEEKYDEAYAAFKAILANSPKDEGARKATFKIAHWNYEQGNLAKALEIYEDAEERWLPFIHEDPKILFNMGEIYFREKQYRLARSHFFDLINLAPDQEIAHKALNRIGDSYFIEENYLSSLEVFNESSRRSPGSRESQYGTVRLADIGIRDSTLPIRDLIFDATAYYQPFKTYKKVFEAAADRDILAEVTLSRGLAFLQEERYLEAIDQFKKLLPLEKESRFHAEARKYIRQALVLLVDRFSKQTGFLPILYSYSDFQSLSIGDIDNLKTLVQIGEAYQAVSMYQEAVKYYEKVKKADAKGIYSERIFLDLGLMHLDQGNYDEAELVARTFLNKYPQTEKTHEAMKLLANAYKGKRQYGQAVQTYRELLERTPGNKAEIYYLLGETHADMDQLPEAVREYRNAVDSYDRSSRVIPEFVPDAYYKLGIAYYKNKDYDNAREALKTAKTLFPEHELRDWNVYMLADSMEKLKEKDKAEAELNGLIKSESVDELLKKAAASQLKVMDWEKKYKDLL